MAEGERRRRGRALRVSKKNALFQEWLALKHNRQKRHKLGVFLVEGTTAIDSAVRHGWQLDYVMPALPPAYAWETPESPETAPFDQLHYLMQPMHALEIALKCELQAQQYFEKIAASKAPATVRKAAAEMADEEREHVRLIRDWMKRVPPVKPGWDEDLDPPRVTE